jgi:AcrR family transcriptional regulator
MGIEQRKTRHKADLKTKILAASQKILLHEGFGALTMRRLADEIEYSPGTLYLHFKDREAIVCELGRIGLKILADYMRPASAIAEPVPRLLALGEAYVRFSCDHPGTYRLIFMEDGEMTDAMFRPQSGESAPGASDEALTLLIEAAQLCLDQAGPGPAIDPVRKAESIWSALHGVAALNLTCGKFLRTPTNLLVRDAILALSAPLPVGSSDSFALRPIPAPPL